MRTPYESSPGYIVIIRNPTEKCLGDQGAIEIASAVSQHQDWFSIQLDSNQIGHAGAEQLANAIEKKHIECFCLKDNPIGDIGANHIADTLKNPLSQLDSLHLNICNIGDAGAIALARSLEINKTLKTLDLRDNDIGDHGTIALAEALRENQSLENIFLDGNHISDHGAIALATALRENRGLKKVFLDRNRISQHGVIALDDATKGNEVLKSISLYGNLIPERSAEHLLSLDKSRRQPLPAQLSLAPPPRNRFHDKDEKKEYLAGPGLARSALAAPTPALAAPTPALAAPTPARATTALKPTHVGKYGVWNKKHIIGGVIFVADVIANLTSYFVGGALSTFLFSPPGVILSVFLALVALSCQVVRQKGPKSQ